MILNEGITWRQEFSLVHLSTGMNTLPISGARFPFWYLTINMPSFAWLNLGTVKDNETTRFV